jgi:hypothetical protein
MALLGATFTLILTLTCLNVYEYYLNRHGSHEKEELGKLKKEIASNSSEFASGDDEINAEDPFDGSVYNQNAAGKKVADTGNDPYTNLLPLGFACWILDFISCHFNVLNTPISTTAPIDAKAHV